MKPNTKALTFRHFPSDLIWRAKVMAAERQITLKRFVEEAMSEKIGRKEKGQ